MELNEDWILQVIGKPWKLAGRGPDDFDCYGLLRWVYGNYFGVELPSHESVEMPPPCQMGFSDHKKIVKHFANHFAGWKKLDRPKEGCGVALSKFGTYMHHCGIYTTRDNGMVIHASEHSRVCAQTLKGLKFSGWQSIEFYEYVGG